LQAVGVPAVLLWWGLHTVSKTCIACGSSGGVFVAQYLVNLPVLCTHSAAALVNVFAFSECDVAVAVPLYQ
jgi:hypothetical protein